MGIVILSTTPVCRLYMDFMFRLYLGYICRVYSDYVFRLYLDYIYRLCHRAGLAEQGLCLLADVVSVADVVLELKIGCGRLRDIPSAQTQAL